MELIAELNAAGPTIVAASPHSGSGFTRAPSSPHVKGAGSSINARSPHPPSGSKVTPAPPAAFLLVFLLILLCAGGAAACPSCKEGLSSSENPAASAKLTRGWARSIYLLMWTPYLLFGGVTLAIVRSARRSKENI